MTQLDIKKIATISLVFAFIFYWTSKVFPELNIWNYSFISFAISSILYALEYLYEKYLWNKHFLIKKIFTIMGFKEYPNIAGKWKVKYYSSYKYDWDKEEYKIKGTGKIVIKKIKGGFQYSGNFSESKFKSSFNSFERNENNKKEWSVGYKYFNSPTETNLSKTGFVAHSGFTILSFDEEVAGVMSGYYGTDENRKTRGKISLTRI